MKTTLFLIIGLLVSCQAAHAQAIITVCPDGSCDFTQLQPAIDSIPVGGTGEIQVSAGNYVGGGITFGGVTVTIKGAGAEDTILTQTGSQRIMRIASGNVVTLDNLTIRDGIANTTNDEGGGIRVASGATLEMSECIIRENESIGDGAGVWVADGAYSSFVDCQFIDNQVTGPSGSGGGLYLGWIDGNTIERCGFHRNVATHDGGGLYQARGSQSTGFTTEFCQLRNSVFWENFAGGIGGAAVVEPALADCVIPRVIGYVTNCTFFKNYAEYGGGLSGHSAEWCGSSTAAEGLTIFVFNSIFRQNEPESIESNQPTYRGCSINTLTPSEANAIDCNNLNPQLVGDSQDLEKNPPDTIDARLMPESFMIERGISSYFGVTIDPGLLDYNGAQRLFDDPNTDNSGPSLLDIGAAEYNLEVLEELDDLLGIGLSIWTNDTGNNLYDDPNNWFDSEPPTADRGWLINEEVITVELPDNSGKDGAAVLGALASFRGTLNLVSPKGGTSLLQVPDNDRLPFQSGIYLGLVYSSVLNLDESIAVECDVLTTSRARILMNGGVISVNDSVMLESDQSSDPGPVGLRISTLHGPGLIQRIGSSGKTEGEFDPVLVNNGRIRVDDLIEIEGDYEQTSGTLKFQSRAGDDLSSIDRRVEVDGKARLGGTIVFDIGPAAWEPEVGDCFPLLSASEGFESGYESFDFVVTRWASDTQNRFFVLSNEPCKEGLQGSGSSETVHGVVVSLDALQSQNETLQSVGVTLRDLLMFDVDGDGFEDMVLSIDTGNSNGQVVVLLNQGLNGSSQWQGFEPFGSVTGVTVDPEPRGLDAGYFANGKTLGGKLDIVVANQSGSVTLLRNLSTPGGTDFSVLQTINLVNGEPDSDGVNPQPVSVCAMNFDEDPCGLTDLVVSCLDNSVWTFQNTLDCGAGFQQLGGDPMENSNREDDSTEEPITKFVPGLGSGGGKRNDKTSASGASKDGGNVDSGRKDDAFGGTGFTLTFTEYPVLAGAEVVDIAEGDIDLDGDLDIVVANRGDDSFGILLATGPETYDPVIIIELDLGFVETDSVTLADIEGDGDLDIALICKNNLSGLRVARVIRNTFVEQGSLGWVFDAQELLIGLEPYLLRSSDVDGDGIDDLLALTESTNFAGPGGFGFGVVGARGAVACLGDLDGDGFVSGSDLAVLLGSWGACAGSCIADLDESGDVNGADLATLLGAWGACNPGID
jgi:hypothetical protein